eukprot:Em0004g664a
MIHTSYSGSTYNTQEDISDASVLLNKFNTGDGQGKVWDGYCLAHLFTYWVLSNGLLGLSNIASPSATTTGGICSTSFFSSSSGTRIIYNTALSSYTSSSNLLVFVEEVLVTGHEIGHSWGSYHDPATTPSCSNVFIMNQYAQDGSQPTHKMFSNCSRTSIGAVLSAKAQNCFTDLYLYSYTGFPPSTFIFAIRMVGATKMRKEKKGENWKFCIYWTTWGMSNFVPALRRFSGDGAKFTRTSNMMILSFCNHTRAAVKGCEDYETISKAFVIGRPFYLELVFGKI